MWMWTMFIASNRLGLHLTWKWKQSFYHRR